MRVERLGCVFGLAPLGVCLVAGLLVTSRDAAAEPTCATAQCHDSLLRAGTVHEATESCDNCHESIASPHPQKGKVTFELTQQPPELCFDCHDAFGKKKDVHPPVQEGACTSCHSPHASSQAKLLLKPLKELCQDCHSEGVDAKFPHGPAAAGECTSCHAPHESDVKPLLAKTGDELCFGCHQEVRDTLAKKNVHPAIDEGCTSCHLPHGGPNPKLLAKAGAELCFQCHDDIESVVQKAAVQHPALEEGCTSCHSPHASDQGKLLLETETEVCTNCHGEILTKAMTTLHGPIAKGSCTACHQPHGSQQAKLLVKDFPTTSYVPYTDKAYELCFSCHKRDLVQYPDTSFATGFRDGDRNLHYVHVNNAEKGRSCALCHNLHGGTNPVLIADSVPFGKWKLPLKFVKTETGGSCAPGCHRSQSYDRVNPDKKPEPTKPVTKSN
jgi:predicted CXXCH cytochrome family protein